ncbi:MAG TPA: S8 family serine peptidase, partial [Candidatus Dormibacteraeota bacterium]|nr:S8 family serine peptidase [Candidatus Dormibacteraeota bacterium]
MLAGLLWLVPSTHAAPAAPVPFSQERILIIPKAGHDAALGNEHATERVKVLRKFPRLGNIHILDLPPGADPQAVIERYRRNGHVDVAALDYQGWRPAATPNDPLVLNGTQWHLNNTGLGGGIPDADIDAPEGWDIQNSTTNVIVAVVDTGARVTHEDLAPNLWTNKAFASLNDNHLFTNDVTDEYNHGTHVVGILGAVGNNGVGGCGVLWKAKIIPLKFIGGGNGYDSDFITCLDYARTNGAKVINCSVTSTITEPALEAAFASLQAADIVVSAAAGNAGTDNDLSPVYPANYKFNNILSVTATDRSDVHYTTGGAAANYGATTVHLAAPGIGIYSTLNGSDGDYGFISGTSMAAPMVSGAAALLRAKFTNESAPQI